MSSSKREKGKQRGTERASKRGKSAKRHSKGKTIVTSTGLPGVQKLKAALRQTKRLLAKENLAADIRVQTERRLKSLENDLAKVEQARIERTMASRYHKVKFFERQKALRKIAQISKVLESGVDAEGEKLGKKQRKALEKDLLERRVDLNYILNYPKTIKYISLYPSHQDDEGDERMGSDLDEKRDDKTETNETSLKRAHLRDQIRQAMASGELNAEPEKAIGSRSQWPAVEAPQDKKEEKRTHRNKDSKVRDGNATAVVFEDDFFEAE